MQTTETLTVNWKPGQILLKKGTPVDEEGNVANDASAYGIVSEDAERPAQAKVLTEGTWDEETNYAGYALTDECKRALSSITFTGSEGERHPVKSLPEPLEADAGKQAAVNEAGNAYEVKEPDPLPAATTEKAGAVKMAAGVQDSEEETAPTTVEFNALLASLRAAGIIETTEEQET